MSDTGQRLSGRAIFAYAALGVATKALTLPLISYLPPLYAAQSGASLAMVGLLFMVARFWDILIDPAVGYAMDRSNPPFGRRKFWIGAAVPILLVTIWPLFVPGSGSHPVAAAAILFFFYLGWTILTIGHAAWPAELSDQPRHRMRLIGWREWAGVIGMISMVLVPMAAARGQKLPLADQARSMAVYVLALLPVAAAFTLAFLPAQARTHNSKPRLADGWRLIARSPRLRGLLLADLLSGGAYAANSATAYFIVSDYMELGDHYSTIMLCIMLGMIVGVPLMMRLSIAQGRRRGFAIAMLGAAAASLAIGFVPRENLIAAMAINVALGVFTGGYQVNLNAAMVDLADVHRKATGQDAVSVHLALLAMTNKLGYALAVGVVYGMLNLLGYTVGYPSAVGTVALLAVGLALPALLFTASVFAFWIGDGRDHSR